MVTSPESLLGYGYISLKVRLERLPTVTAGFPYTNKTTFIYRQTPFDTLTRK